MKKYYIYCILSVMLIFVSACKSNNSIPDEVVMTKDQLLDKIKGGWAGQTIGCTFGGPTEFRYQSTMINKNIDIVWPEGYIKWYYENFPGLYDDIYMDLTFVKVFEEKGLDAPIKEFADAFANSEYPLWHANQQARYNIQHGIMPPYSGHWLNNPHADDIDFQIEADYAGLMAPGMVNTAAYYCDEIGHMMNYGDGWYGGVYVAAMYALAFISDDVDFIVKEALKTIPSESKYYKCMSDVIKWHDEYPEDWVLTWAKCEEEWSFDIGCPDGVYSQFNIDAIINSAYVLIGLLYGEGDFYRTMDISTRCGQDSDCNPATAAGILGTMYGYSRIPEKWMPNLREVEDLNFAYTDISLNKTYEMSYNQALKVIHKNGGSVLDDKVVIKCEKPQPVRFEESFTNHWPILKEEVEKDIRTVNPIVFNGNGVVVGYNLINEKLENWEEDNSGYVAEVEIYLDSQLVETAKLPAKTNDRKLELFYKYDLSEKEQHKLEFVWKNPEKNRILKIRDYLIYSRK